MFKRVAVVWTVVAVGVLSATADTPAVSKARAAQAAFENGRYDEAARTFTELLRAAEAAGQPEAVATASNNLGMAYVKQGRLRQADRLLRNAVRTWESLAPQSLDLAISLENLGQLRDRQGRGADVVALLARALALKARILGLRHPDLLVPYAHLASVHHRAKNLAEAEHFYLEAIAAGGDEASPHSGLPLVLNNLAVLYRERGDLRDAERVLRRAAVAAEAAVPPDYTQLAGILENLAILVWHQGRTLEATHLHLRAEAARDPERLAVRTGW
jgi:tetratricopeptide (TPR) repeat protein